MFKIVAYLLVCLVAITTLVGQREARACKVLSSPRGDFTPPAIRPKELAIIGSMAVRFSRGRFSLSPCADMARLTLDPKLDPERGDPAFMALYVASGWVDGIEHATVQPGGKAAFVYERQAIESAWPDPDGDRPTFMQGSQQVSLVAVFFDHSGEAIGRTPEFVVAGPRFSARGLSAATWGGVLFTLLGLAWVIKRLVSRKRKSGHVAQQNR